MSMKTAKLLMFPSRDGGTLKMECLNKIASNGNAKIIRPKNGALNQIQ